MGTDEQWQAWGKADPYFAVYTEDKFRKDTIGQNRDAFFETGERSVSHYLDEAYRTFGEPDRARALDFGCGVGRLSIPLAKRFGEVVGVDISEEMLDEARRNAELASLDNLTFVRSDDDLSHVRGEFDLVLSYIVLQHLPPDRGMSLLAKLADKLAPGGIIVVQASAQRRKSIVERLKYTVKNEVPQLAAAIRFLQGRGWSTLTMRMTDYDVISILRLLSARGMANVLVSEHLQGGALTYRFTARRPLASG